MPKSWYEQGLGEGLGRWGAPLSPEEVEETVGTGCNACPHRKVRFEGARVIRFCSQGRELGDRSCPQNWWQEAHRNV